MRIGNEGTDGRAWHRKLLPLNDDAGYAGRDVAKYKIDFGDAVALGGPGLRA